MLSLWVQRRGCSIQMNADSDARDCRRPAGSLAHTRQIAGCSHFCPNKREIWHGVTRLFLIYINDLPELCAAEDPNSEIYLYAGDSKIYKVINNNIDQQKLQSVMNLIKIGRMSGFLD